ncbi:hypothetical protein SEA_TOMAS_201 [Streptomyces phage Tomas]|uniref:Uncharacterized protein n=1 Tax=Streptomyces phage Tomas TaxID=2914443 RepID=A0AA49BSD3_9CAUD|nr:hypothetical protein PP453_gp118 [Streptomyces phage Tomas]UMO76349.1 hypothetical protein SEA_TOMAS_201 [Streptomyces phage Tomas]
MRANEEWREDPVRRAAARKLCSDRAFLYNKLIKSLETAQISLYQLQDCGEEKPTMYRNTNFVSLIEDYKRSYKHYSNPTETLIGNMAAFGKGTNV